MANHSGIADNGGYFQIIPTTRKIIVPAGHNVIGAVGDKNSEQITFKCPKLIDGHNIVDCTDHWVICVNANKEKSTFPITYVNADDEFAYFTWTIAKEVTKKQGNISFSVVFEDIENTVTLYRWGTYDCKDCSIVPTSESNLEENGESAIPDGYVKPYLKANITANGTYNATNWETATINVQQSAANSAKLGVKTITENDVYRAEDEELDGYSQVTVDVQPNLQEKDVTVTGNQSVTYDSGYDGLSKVNITVSERAPNYQTVEKTVKSGADDQEINIEPTGTYDAISKVILKVTKINPQPAQTVTPTKVQQTITKNDGYDTLGTVYVDPIPSDYIKPSGTKTITSNTNSVDVKQYEYVKVAVPSDAKEEETKTVTLNFSSGNMTVNPTSGKVLSQITITKPADLIAANIKKGVTIAGITGTFEGYVEEAKMYIFASKSTSVPTDAATWGSGYNVADGEYIFETSATGYVYICTPSVITKVEMDNMSLLGDGITKQSDIEVGGRTYHVYRTDGRQTAGGYNYIINFE